jgi:hypothetical protein
VSDARLELIFPAELVEQIAQLAAAIAKEQLRSESEPPRWMTIEQAVAYSTFPAQHIYDMRSDGRLTKHGARGHALVDRRELDAYLDNT